MDFQEALTAILRFRDEREWRPFHNPRNLAAALAIEASEIQELFLWKTDSEISQQLSDPLAQEALEEEIADVLIFLLLLAHEARIDPVAAISRKLRKNDARYPVELSKGRAIKYTNLSPAPSDKSVDR
jgi:NTP pyrophosphatase (non-canonical NTP hydrolase)